MLQNTMYLRFCRMFWVCVYIVYTASQVSGGRRIHASPSLSLSLPDLPLTRSRNNCRAGNKGLAAVKSTVARSILKPCERSAAAKGRQNTLTVGLSAAPRKKREHTSPPRAVFATRENNRIKAHQ